MKNKVLTEDKLERMCTCEGKLDQPCADMTHNGVSVDNLKSALEEFERLVGDSMYNDPEGFEVSENDGLASALDLIKKAFPALYDAKRDEQSESRAARVNDNERQEGENK